MSPSSSQSGLPWTMQKRAAAYLHTTSQVTGFLACEHEMCLGTPGYSHTEPAPACQLGIAAVAMLMLLCWLQDAAVRGSIKTVQVKGQGSGWLSMTNIWGAAWEIQQSPQPPLDFRFVDDSGSEVTLEAIPFRCLTPQDLQLHAASQ